MIYKWNKNDTEYYLRGLKLQCKKVERLLAFKEGKLSDAEMVEKFSNDYKRIIGIDIACYDEQNAKLPYPIKITHNPNAVYEDCNPSLSDPNQGWEY